MDKNRRLVLALGAAVAVLAGVSLAVIFYGKPQEPAKAPGPDDDALQVSVNDVPAPGPDRKLRCYVEGLFVGEYSLAECAQKNGVAAQALDVGLDASGALVAAPTASNAPPPALPPASATAPVQVPPASAPTSAGPSTPAAQPAAAGPACLSHSGSEWRQVAEATSLNACVQALFAGRCVRPGDALYGRWGDTTLRLVPRRVEQSADNRTFRPLVEQRRGCEIPQIR